ncbi:MAG: FAD-dependent oxidoreductase, partial [Candidatus Omnitrophica bacterium]|nr:FAD-dependent oxidoreductase [Candidatus Omnitrophota bacterium]
DAALQLIKIAKQVYIINNTAALGGDPLMRDKIVNAENASVLNSANITSILGDKMVSAVKIIQDGKESQLAVEGIFVEIGLIPNSGFAHDVEKNQVGEIKVNCNNETNIPGIFAAGDVTDVPEKQIIIAAGEGAKASLGAFKYLVSNKF